MQHFVKCVLRKYCQSDEPKPRPLSILETVQCLAAIFEHAFPEMAFVMISSYR